MTPRESPARHPTVAELEAHVLASSSLRRQVVERPVLAQWVEERRRAGVVVEVWTARRGDL